MSTNVGFATLSVIPGLSGFDRALERGTTPAMTRAGALGGRAFGDGFTRDANGRLRDARGKFVAEGKRSGRGFGSAFMGSLGAIGVFSAASGALRFLGDSVQEGREAVKVGRQTAAVIKSTSGAAKVTEKQVGRLAKQLSRMAGIDDEIIQSGSNVLLTFKNIRNESGEGNKVFDKANKAALNLSVALGKDLNSSALMVGKALNDPVAGMTALGRAGVQFSKDQKDAIKKMVETGDTVGAQKAILRELNDQFRGSAKAQRTEADKLSVAFGDFKEEIGTALLPVLDDLATFIRKKGIPRAREFFGFIRDEGVPAAKNIAKFAEKAAGKVKGLVDAFNGMPDWAKKVLAGGAVVGAVAKKLGVGDVLFKRGSTPANPLYVFDIGGKKGGLGKVPLLGGLLGTTGLVAGIAGGVTAGVSKALGPKNLGLLGAGSGGSGSLPSNPDGGSFFDLDGTKGLDGAKGKVQEFNAELTRTQQLFVDSKSKANDYFMFVKRNAQTEIRFTVTGWDVANRDAREYLSLLLQIRGAHMDTRLDAAGGSGPTTPGTPGKPGGLLPAGRGVNFSGPITVTAHDYKDFTGQMQRRATAASLDGWRK